MSFQKLTHLGRQSGEMRKKQARKLLGSREEEVGITCRNMHVLGEEQVQGSNLGARRVCFRNKQGDD